MKLDFIIYFAERVKQSTDCDDNWTSVIKMFEKVKLSRNVAVKKDENIDVGVLDEPNEGLSDSEAYSCLTVGLK
ncbi:hypothetical protein T4D_10757 [Trichinella pseudospiralis]|uniref:Uncharacterized protein n=1 Tax=Trichinella pseudospiralis TaxID=6337 RepID=A0A0V1FPD7_TRIPS|nr:hypothetical protein T4D_10757 [Trichinella pseudospiralis]